eukprot:m.18526 g.18526  ORF g.18526 m.18526 type:complete len:181 (-) comp4974_c1_seq1:72-614(-)
MSAEPIDDFIEDKDGNSIVGETKRLREQAIIRPDGDTLSRARSLVHSLETVLTNVANEPSIALFYTQHHIRKTTPAIINLDHKMKDDAEEWEGISHDATFSIEMLEEFAKIKEFDSIQEHVSKALAIYGYNTNEVDETKQGVAPSRASEVGEEKGADVEVVEDIEDVDNLDKNSEERENS